MTHSLKTWPEFFDAIKKGDKTFEIRKADRPFKRGETLILQEWDNNTKQYTGEELERVITYILPGGEFGLKKGYVAMGLCEKEHYV